MTLFKTSVKRSGLIFGLMVGLSSVASAQLAEQISLENRVSGNSFSTQPG
jgi:hypothetical protein